MNRLRRYDKVAYVRFASVYLDFKDVQIHGRIKGSAEDQRTVEMRPKSAASKIADSKLQ